MDGWMNGWIGGSVDEALHRPICGQIDRLFSSRFLILKMRQCITENTSDGLF